MTNKLLPARKYRVFFLLICGTGLYFFANLQRVAIPGTVFNHLQENLHAGAPYITALGASFMYVYAVSQLLVGLFLDRYGGIRTILAGGFLFCLGSLLFPLFRSLPILYLIRALMGLGASTIYLSMVMEISRAFPRNYSRVIAIFLMIGYFGGIAAGAPLEGCIGGIGFTGALLLTGALAFLFYAGFGFSGSTLKLPPVRNDRPIRLGNFSPGLRIRHNRILFIFNALSFALYYVLQTVIGKKFMEDFCLISSTRAAMYVSILGGFCAVSSFLAALLSKLLGNRRKPPCLLNGFISVAVFACIILMILFNCRSHWIFPLLSLLAVTSSLGPVFISIIQETNDPSITGSMIAMNNFIAYIVLAVLGNAVGFLLRVFPPELRNGIEIYSRESYLVLFGFLGLLSVISLVMALLLKETHGRFTEVS